MIYLFPQYWISWLTLNYLDWSILFVCVVKFVTVLFSFSKKGLQSGETKWTLSSFYLIASSNWIILNSQTRTPTELGIKNFLHIWSEWRNTSQMKLSKCLSTENDRRSKNSCCHGVLKQNVNFRSLRLRKFPHSTILVLLLLLNQLTLPWGVKGFCCFHIVTMFLRSVQASQKYRK